MVHKHEKDNILEVLPLRNVAEEQEIKMWIFLYIVNIYHTCTNYTNYFGVKFVDILNTPNEVLVWGLNSPWTLIKNRSTSVEVHTRIENEMTKDFYKISIKILSPIPILPNKCFTGVGPLKPTNQPTSIRKKNYSPTPRGNRQQ